jgi:putative peptidoglycan lipid II flippase
MSSRESTSAPDSSKSGQPSPAVNSRPWLLSGLRIVASTTLLSRVLGMFRDMATARLFGISPVMDAFAIAFRIPNLARRLFGEGALSASFLPVFTREWERGKDGHPWQLASAVFSLMSVVLIALVLVGEGVLAASAYWYGQDPHTRLLLGLTAVMLPYALFICLAAQVTAVLHALGEFAVPSMVPVVLNLCLLATIYFVDPLFEPHREQQAYALAVCVLIAGVLQLALQWPALRKRGFRFTTQWQHARDGVREIIRAVIPVTLGLSITQINTLLDSVIAWIFSGPAGTAEGVNTFIPWLSWLGNFHFPLEAGAVSTLYYGERLYQLPVGVFGVALGTVLFPLLSRHAARGDFVKLREDVGLSLRLALAIGVPASAGLMVMALPITRLLFEHGSFLERDAERTAAMIVAYGAAVWADCSIPLLYRAFYAMGERQAAMKVGMRIVALDLLLNVTLIWPLAERGLAWSTAITAVVHVGMLVWLLQKRVGALQWGLLIRTSGKVIAGTAAMSGACLLTIRLIPQFPGLQGEILAVAAPVLAGIAVYLLFAFVLRLDEVWMLLRREKSSVSTAEDAALMNDELVED